MRADAAGQMHGYRIGPSGVYTHEDDDHNLSSHQVRDYNDEDAALEKVVSPSTGAFLNIGKVESINYFSGKQSSRGGNNNASQRHANGDRAQNESMESISQYS